MNEKSIMRAVEMMMRTNRMHRSLIDSRATRFGIHRSQHRMLMHLSREGTTSSQKALAECFDISAAAVTGTLKKLEGDGYITRKLGQDNRYNEICITEKGKQIVDRSRRCFLDTDMSLFEGFSEEELASYIRCLEKMQRNIEKQKNKGEGIANETVV